MGNTLRALKAPVEPDVPNQEDYEEIGSDEESSSTCQICIEPMVKKFRNCNGCSHPFCNDCTVQYIRFSLENDNTGQISCPAFNCGRKLDPQAWASTIGPTLFVKWCDILAKAAILTSDRCYCPNLKCNELIVNECGGNPKKSQCPNCKNWFCFKCIRYWHEGRGCDKEDSDDLAVRVLMKKNKWKRCPACKYFIELSKGCPVVKCRCGIEFCYDCGKKVHHRRGYCSCTYTGLLAYADVAIRCSTLAGFTFWISLILFVLYNVLGYFFSTT